jgi:hypothetical protein
MTPITIAAMHTAEASDFTIFKAQTFGTVTYMADDEGYVFKCVNYKGKTYMLHVMQDVVGTPFDFIVGLIRSGLSILGAFGLATHLGLYFGGFYQWLAVKYPDNIWLHILGA